MITALAKSTLTKDARGRLANLKMSESDLIELLDKRLYVSLGFENGSPKVHKLCFSKADKEYFVAVQDQNTRTVVTIFLIKGYNRRQVPKSAFIRLKRLVQGPPQPEPRTQPPRRSNTPAAPLIRTQPRSTPPAALKYVAITVSVQLASGEIKLEEFTEWPISQYGTTFGDVLRSKDFMRDLLTAVRAKFPDGSKLKTAKVRGPRREETFFYN